MIEWFQISWQAFLTPITVNVVNVLIALKCIQGCYPLTFRRKTLEYMHTHRHIAF
jgi:hypothetical protein